VQKEVQQSIGGEESNGQQQSRIMGVEIKPCRIREPAGWTS